MDITIAFSGLLTIVLSSILGKIARKHTIDFSIGDRKQNNAVDVMPKIGQFIGMAWLVISFLIGYLNKVLRPTPLSDLVELLIFLSPVFVGATILRFRVKRH
ncbi:hypothetical protein D6779_02420 [Candidatus Parcubacteria bacterium]|nr:MAG: hypothetical protein D6779_02420 [Candidatus Parcubacteria bacterium]